MRWIVDRRDNGLPPTIAEKVVSPYPPLHSPTQNDNTAFFLR